MNDKGLSDRSPETGIAPAGNCLGRGDFSIIRLSGQFYLRSRRIFPLPGVLIFCKRFCGKTKTRELAFLYKIFQVNLAWE